MLVLGCFLPPSYCSSLREIVTSTGNGRSCSEAEQNSLDSRVNIERVDVGRDKEVQSSTVRERELEGESRTST
jgi:hypothetical protein